MEIGVLYLSHAMLVLDKLIVCSMRGFACILAKWFWPTVMVSLLHMEVPRPGKVCDCVCGIYVFVEDRNILRSFLIG